MGIVIRQTFKASIASYLGVAIGALNMLYIFPKYLGAEGIGLMNVIYSAAILFLPILQLGLPTSIIKYFPVFKERQMLNYFLGYALLLPLLVFLIFGLLWPWVYDVFEMLFEERAKLILDNVFWVIPLSGILIYVNVFETISYANHRITIPSLLKNVVWRASISVSVLLIAFGLVSLDYLVPLYVITWGIVLIGMFVNVVGNGWLSISLKKGVWKDKDILAFKKYSAFVILIAIGGVLIQRIDQFMVASFLGTKSAGVFTLAMYLASLIEIPKRSFVGIIQPILSKSFSDNDLTEVNEIYHKSSINLMFIGGVIFVLIWSSVGQLFQIIPNGEQFVAGTYVVLFYGLSRFVDMSAGCNTEIILFSKYYKINFLFQSILVLIVVLSNWYFIPKYDITGAALATFSAEFIFNFLRFIFVWWKLKIQPFSFTNLKTLFVLTIGILIGEYFPDLSNPYLTIALKSVVVVATILPLGIWLNLSPELNKLYFKYVKRNKL